MDCSLRRGNLARHMDMKQILYFVALTILNNINPRPYTPIFITRTCRGGGRIDPPRVSKLRVLKFSEKKRRISLDKYSRLVVRFFVLGQYLTQL